MEAQNPEIESLKRRIAALEETRLQKYRRNIRQHKRLSMLIACLLVALPVAIYAAMPFTFTAGTAAVASEVNSNFTKLDNISVPVGGIVAWHQNLTGVPALPGSGEWVKCDGQTLADAASPLNGQVIPNLNGNAGGADSPGHAAKVAMFLRGGITSGTGQQDAFQGHWHRIIDHANNVWAARVGANGADFTGLATNNSGGIKADIYAKDVVGNDSSASNPGALFNGANSTGFGTPRTASETRPSNMSVVWIMRVK